MVSIERGWGRGTKFSFSWAALDGTGHATKMICGWLNFIWARSSGTPPIPNEAIPGTIGRSNVKPEASHLSLG